MEELKVKKYKHQMDLTTGNLFRKIPFFVFPLAMTTIFQLLYTTIDLWTVSKFGGGSSSMAAVGSNSAMINLIITFLASLATGANVVIAQAKGSLNKEKAEKTLHTSFLIAVFGGLIFGVFGFYLSGILLKFMGTPSTLIDKATLYVKIYFLGLPFMMIYNFGSQMLRALGDSKRPLFFLVISGLINVILDFTLVYFFNLDVVGVAVATDISSLVSALCIILWFKFSKTVYISLHFSKLHFDRECLKEILKIGVPAGIQGMAFCIPNVMIQSSLYTIDNYYIDGVYMTQDEIVAGAAASAQVENYVFSATNSFSLATVSFVGQNYGAKKKKNIYKTLLYAVIWMTTIWLVLCGIVGFFPNQLLSIFLEEEETINITHAIACGKERLFLLTFTYLLDGIMDVCGSFLRGMKVSTTPAIITLIGCTGSRILFLLTLFKMPYFHTIYWLYMAFPISWILVDITYVPVLLHYKKKIIDKI